MAGRRKTIGAEEVRMLGLLLSGDIAGFERATGMNMREMELRMRAAGELGGDAGEDGAEDDDPGDDEFYFDDDDDDDDDDEDDDWRLRPEWLHADCVDPCQALDLGTCCKYPVSPLVRRAGELADSAARTLDSRDRDSASSARDLARLLRSLPRLLAQIHAVLPGLDRTCAAQLTCPVGRLAGAVGQACQDGTARADAEPLRPLLEACSDALWAAARPRPLQLRERG